MNTRARNIRIVCATLALVPLTLAGLAACDRRSAQPSEVRHLNIDAPPQNKFGFAEALHSPPRMAMPETAADAATAARDAAAAASQAARDASSTMPEGIPPSAISVGLPKIAYTYNYAYRVAAEEIPALQRRHADFCEAQGPRVCRILSLRQSGDEGDYSRGWLELAVASSRARGFGTELARSVKAAGGKEVSSAISGEDLSKQIVDTEARLRARSLLRDRLMEVLASRKGTVAELVEAERGVAQVNEEIDEARSWLSEMTGRVEFSRLTVEYSAGAPAQSGFAQPIRSVWGNIGAIVGQTLAVLLALAAIALPIGPLVWMLLRLRRRLRERRTATEAASAE